MKTKLCLLCLYLAVPLSAQVAINTDGAAPHASAMLEVNSTNSGVLIPRMTAAQRDAIPSPATGLMVYVTDDNLFHFYNGNAWTAIAVPDADGSATNELQTLSLNGTDLTLSNGGGTVSIADNDNNSSNEIQTLSKSGTTVSLSNGGGSVSIADNDNSSTNEIQTLSKSGTTVSLSNGGGSVSIADNDNSSTNEIQTLSRSGTNLSLSNSGGTVSIATTTMASTEGGGTTQVIRGGSGTTWDNTGYNAFLSDVNNGDRVLVFASFLMKLSGGSGTDKGAFRIEADNQSGGSQYSMNTGTIDDLQRDKWVLYSFHRFIEINQGSGNYRFYLQVDESLTDDSLIFDQQEISVIKF